MEGQYSKGKLSDVGYSRLVEGTREFFQGLPVSRTFDTPLKLNGGNPSLMPNDLVMNYSALSPWKLAPSPAMAPETATHLAKTLKSNFESQPVTGVYPSSVLNGYRLSSGMPFTPRDDQNSKPLSSRQVHPQQLGSLAYSTAAPPKFNNVFTKCDVSFSDNLCYTESAPHFMNGSGLRPKSEMGLPRQHYSPRPTTSPVVHPMYNDLEKNGTRSLNNNHYPMSPLIPAPKPNKRESPLDLSVKTVRQTPDSTADDCSLHVKRAMATYELIRGPTPITNEDMRFAVTTAANMNNHEQNSFVNKPFPFAIPTQGYRCQPKGPQTPSNDFAYHTIAHPETLGPPPPKVSRYDPPRAITPNKFSASELKDRLRPSENAQLVKSILRNSLEQKNEMKFRSLHTANYVDPWPHWVNGKTELPSVSKRLYAEIPVKPPSSPRTSKLTPPPMLSPNSNQIMEIAKSSTGSRCAASSPRQSRVHSPRGPIPPLVSAAQSPSLIHSPVNFPSKNTPCHPLPPKTPPVLVSQPTSNFPLISPQPLRAKAPTPTLIDYYPEKKIEKTENPHCDLPGVFASRSSMVPSAIPSLTTVTTLSPATSTVPVTTIVSVASTTSTSVFSSLTNSIVSTPITKVVEGKCAQIISPEKHEPMASSDGTSRIRTKGELKQMSVPKNQESPVASTPNQIFKSTPRSGSPRSPRGAKSPRSVSPWGSMGMFSKKRDTSVSSVNLMPPKLERSASTGDKKTDLNLVKNSSKESDSSVFDFKESDSDSDMPVLEKQSFEPLRRRTDSVKAILAEKIQQKIISETPGKSNIQEDTPRPSQPSTPDSDFDKVYDGLLQDLATAAKDLMLSPPKIERVDSPKKEVGDESPVLKEEVDFLMSDSSESEESGSDFEKELRDKMRKASKKPNRSGRIPRARAAKKRIPMMKDDSSSSSVSDDSSENDSSESERVTRQRPRPRNRILYNECLDSDDSNRQKGSSRDSSVSKDTSRASSRQEKVSPVKAISKTTGSDSSKANPVGRPKKVANSKPIREPSRKLKDTTNQPEETVSERLRPRKEPEKSSNKVHKKKKKKMPIKSLPVDIHDTLKNKLKAKPEFGDGSGFAPGWEDELFQYKKSVLRMPAQLLPKTNGGDPVRLKRTLSSVQATEKHSKKQKVKASVNKVSSECVSGNVTPTSEGGTTKGSTITSISILRDFVKKYKKSVSGVKAVSSDSAPPSDYISQPQLELPGKMAVHPFSNDSKSQPKLHRAKWKNNIPENSVCDDKVSCDVTSYTSTPISGEPTQSLAEKCNPPVLAGQQPGDSANVIKNGKKKVRYRVMRRKFRSGFDYLRKKKKKKDGDPGVTKKKPPVCPPLEGTLETTGELKDLKEVQADIKTWVVNKGLGETVIHRAARLGYYEAALFCLVNQENAVDMKDNAGYTALHEACSRGHLEMARLLLQFGADPNASAKGGIRPLHEIVESGRCEMARLLLSYGADPSVSTYSGVLPIALAKQKNMKILIQGYLDDINGRPSPPWEFPALASFLDPQPNGYNLLDNIPSVEVITKDPESNAIAVDETASSRKSDEIVFEMSDQPIPNTYVITGQQGKFCVLHELAKSVSKSQEMVRKGCDDSDIFEMTWNEFVERCVCCQVGEGYNYSNIVRPKKGSERKVVLVRLTSKLEAIMKVEVVSWDPT